MHLISKLVENKDFDVDKLDKMMTLQERWEDRRAEVEFNAAMSRVQNLLPEVEKKSDNLQTNSKYAKHEAIALAIKPIYTTEGFSAVFSQGQSDTEGYLRVNGTLRHSAGHSEPHYVDLPLDKAGIKGNVNKTDLHATSSTFTYGRRILTCMMFDVATGDDTDGNLPGALVTEEQANQLRAKFDKLPAKTQTAFLKWALSKPELDGEESVDDLGAKYFDDYMKNLDRKLAQINASS